jgi:hypothetical protein
MPVYISAEISPISAVREIYFKGNMGYNVLFDYDVTGFENASGGVYLGFGAGYVFDFGLMLELMYGYYYGSGETPYGGNMSLSYGKIGLSAGYRFNI